MMHREFSQSKVPSGRVEWRNELAVNYYMHQMYGAFLEYVGKVAVVILEKWKVSLGL